MALSPQNGWHPLRYPRWSWTVERVPRSCKTPHKWLHTPSPLRSFVPWKIRRMMSPRRSLLPCWRSSSPRDPNQNVITMRHFALLLCASWVSFVGQLSPLRGVDVHHVDPVGGLSVYAVGPLHRDQLHLYSQAYAAQPG